MRPRDGRAEEAARFYVSVFRKSKLGRITRYPDVGREIHGHPPDDVMRRGRRSQGAGVRLAQGPFRALVADLARGLVEDVRGSKSKAAERAFGAMMKMKKIDIAALKAAAKGS